MRRHKACGGGSPSPPPPAEPLPPAPTVAKTASSDGTQQQGSNAPAQGKSALVRKDNTAEGINSIGSGLQI